MLSEVDQRRFLVLLCLRCSNGDVTLRDADVAFQLRITPEQWTETKAVLMGKKLITQHNKPVAWERRQYDSDSSNERVQRYRERMKQRRNVTETPPETEIETETESNSKSLARSSLADSHAIYECYPRKVGRKAALRAIELAITRVQEGEYGRPFTREEAVEGIKRRTIMFATSTAGKQGKYTPHATTWFNRSSYLDDPKEWESGDQHSGAEQHSQRNRENILIGLGLSTNVGESG